ncbi:tRNA1(Val) (adenine(37)-N6)-methyltransferase [Candidatus Raskinella chloraquaticus]|uniref:Methyltransferase small domain-containing protein n=1 Tax=Candidatus Raskinella chloraquaticus TaxID=1951219 RepID=A0A1W9HVZ2_9HYPH|nr:MAG: hypothetical protein A4S15_10305 [Proteobacteria bacterium SG_bin8]
MEVSKDHLLGGRVRLRQAVDGYRAGLDAVLLAASIPAMSGERVLDLGCGAGAVSLCLLARVGDCHVTGVEIDHDMAQLAQDNAALNGWEARLSIVAGDISRRGLLSDQTFDHIMANPPFHDKRRHRLPRLEQRAQALVEGEAGVDKWFAVGLRRVKPGGSLTFILRADRLDEALAALGGLAGRITVLPVHSHAGKPAIRVIVQAIKERRTPLSLLPALVLFDEKGEQSGAARDILANGARLSLEGG